MKGLLPAIVTPFGEDGAFLQAPFETLIDRLYGCGIEGLFVCGNCGEASAQDVALRKRVAEIAIACSPQGKRVIVHVGSAGLDSAMELARHASRAGAHAIASLPPDGDFTNAPDYFRQVALAASVPLLVYYCPAISRGVDSGGTLEKLCAVDGVTGLKFTDYRLHEIRGLTASGMEVLSGYDEVLAAGLLLGAHGGIGAFYNIFPDTFVELYRAACSDDWARASMLQEHLNRSIRFFSAFPTFPAIKKLLQLQGFDCGVCRPPHRRLTEAEEQSLSAWFENNQALMASPGFARDVPGTVTYPSLREISKA